MEDMRTSKVKTTDKKDFKDFKVLLSSNRSKDFAEYFILLVLLVIIAFGYWFDRLCLNEIRFGYCIGFTLIGLSLSLAVTAILNRCSLKIISKS